MLNEKIGIIHFYNGKGGGVFSVINNLVSNSENQEIENQIIYILNKRNNSTFKKSNFDSKVTQKVFFYSPHWNLFFTARELAKLIPDSRCLLVAHDLMELVIISKLGLPNPVVFFLHGDYDYYFNLAIKFNSWIDQYICVSEGIANTLKIHLIKDIERVNYLRFPVPNVTSTIQKDSDFNIVFVGRCDESKGYHLLPTINRILIGRGITPKWHIIGSESLDSKRQSIWDNTNVFFYGEISNVMVTEILSRSKVFVLPSYAEGMPVSLVEAMKCGTVPVINNLNSGIRELVIENYTGYLITNNEVSGYADKLEYVYRNELLLRGMSENCIRLSNNLFNPYENTTAIEDCFLKAINQLKTNKPIGNYGSRLDRKYLPNWLVTFLRTTLRRFV